MKIRISRYLETSITSIFMLIFVFLPAFTTIAQDQTEEKATSNSEEIESQMYELKTTLYCFCGCERMTYEICHCGTAIQVKQEFRDALLKGKTVEEIRTDYIEKHGPKFLAIMPAEGINLLAYLMPVVILIAIGGVIFVVRHHSRGNKIPSAQPELQVSEELQQQVESELEKYKEQN